MRIARQVGRNEDNGLAKSVCGDAIREGHVLYTRVSK